jgi:hypothetical protein
MPRASSRPSIVYRAHGSLFRQRTPCLRHIINVLTPLLLPPPLSPVSPLRPSDTGKSLASPGLSAHRGPSLPPLLFSITKSTLIGRVKLGGRDITGMVAPRSGNGKCLTDPRLDRQLPCHCSRTGCQPCSRHARGPCLPFILRHPCRSFRLRQHLPGAVVLRRANRMIPDHLIFLPRLQTHPLRP